MSADSHEAKPQDSGGPNSTILLILTVVILLAYLPMMIMHFQVLWELEQYQYFPFIIAAVGWLGWTRWQEATLVENVQLSWFGRLVHNQLPILWSLLAMATLAVAVYCQWGWFAAVSLNLLTGAGLLVLSQKFHVRNAWGIWLLMWLMVPPPIEFGANVVQRMQLASSLMSSQILDLLRIDHLMTGNVFTLPSKQLFVDEACSGIVSVMSVIAATSIYAVWKDRSLIHAGLLILASVGWALVMNTVRIVTIAVAEANWGYDLAEGTVHEILGLVLFSLTFIASMSTDQFFEFLLTPIHIAAADSDVKRNPLVRAWNWLANCFVPRVRERNCDQSQLNQLLVSQFAPKLTMAVAPIGLVGAWSALVFLGVIGGRPVSLVDPLTLSKGVSSEVLPAAMNEWKQISFESSDRTGENIQGNYDFGQFSSSYIYQSDDNQTVSVSMDYPFTGGWHELSACYRASGWDILERQANTENGREFVETTFKYPDQEQYAYLVFNNFNERGEILTPPSGAILTRSWLFIRRRFLRKIAGDLYQVQAFVVSDKPFDDSAKAQIKQLFLAAEASLTKHVSTMAGSGS